MDPITSAKVPPVPKTPPTPTGTASTPSDAKFPASPSTLRNDIKPTVVKEASERARLYCSLMLLSKAASGVPSSPIPAVGNAPYPAFSTNVAAANAAGAAGISPGAAHASLYHAEQPPAAVPSTPIPSTGGAPDPEFTTNVTAANAAGAAGIDPGFAHARIYDTEHSSAMPSPAMVAGAPFDPRNLSSSQSQLWHRYGGGHFNAHSAMDLWKMKQLLSGNTTHTGNADFRTATAGGAKPAIGTGGIAKPPMPISPHAATVLNPAAPTPVAGPSSTTPPGVLAGR